jgi:pyruvate carboxylase subunit B
MNAKNLKITDVTLRDGQQSLIATRMRTSDMEGIAQDIEKIGLHSVEVWGGATFDAALRFLNEDPWERPRVLKKLLPSTPLQMLLRGQNLVGYRHYADDVVYEFVKQSAEAGIDIFRVFDALNDERNIEVPLKAIKASGKHAQLCICYSLTESKMGGPIYNLDYFVNKALKLEDMGADSICIKDMAGLIAPDNTYTLVSTLKNKLKVPLQFHTHGTSGMGMTSCFQAIEAGVDVVDTAFAPFALRSAAPAIEPFVAVLSGTSRDTGLDLSQLLKLDQYIEEFVAPKYREFVSTNRFSIIDTSVLAHQIPGGMTSNLLLQIKQMHAMDRLTEVLEEVPRVRSDLGYLPLVTPTSQIVGVQALYNVLFGRYKQITTQLQDYCYGLYGRPPATINPDVQRIVLKSYKKGKVPVTVRPADLLEPEMEKAWDATKDITKDVKDVLTYALYPLSGLQFLKNKYDNR